MLQRFVILILLVVGATVFGAAARSDEPHHKPLSIETLLQAEGVGHVVFDSSGQHVIIEKHEPWLEKRRFQSLFMFDADRTSLFSYNADRPELSDFIRACPEGRCWVGSFSPNGKRVAVYWFEGDLVRTGVYEFENKQLRKFDIVPSMELLVRFTFPHWISDTELLYQTTSLDDQLRTTSRNSFAMTKSLALAEAAWDGSSPSVKVYGGKTTTTSGETRSLGELVKVSFHAHSTTITPIKEGDHLTLYGGGVSSDSRYFAALMLELDPTSAGKSTDIVNRQDLQRRLTIVDLRKNTSWSPCATCDIATDSLVWSPDGRLLAFGARRDGIDSSVYRYYTYNLEKHRLDEFSLPDLNIELVDGYQSPISWIGNRLAALAAAATDENSRRDWYALGDDGLPLSLSVSFASPPNTAIGTFDGALLLMDGGDLVSVTLDGDKQNLTRSIGFELKPWCGVVNAYWRVPGYRPFCTSSGGGPGVITRHRGIVDGRVAFVADGPDASESVVILDLVTGSYQKIDPKLGGYEVIAISRAAGVAVYLRNGEAGSEVVLARSDGTIERTMSFNTHLATALHNRKIALFRERVNGEVVEDLLLLPHDYQSSERLPLIVYFYPGSVGIPGNVYERTHSPTAVSYLNLQPIVANGYAALIADVDLPPIGSQSDPMFSMHEELVLAAENVVANGYAESENWGLIGHSYGGYGALAVATQTKRFKAIVAGASAGNLSSQYGTVSSVEGVLSTGEALPAAVFQAEVGQLRMGSAPWSNPERYVRNSPVFHADDIETPVLLIHGDLDFVPVSQAEEIYTALHRQGRDVTLLRYWGEGHVLFSPENILHANNYIADFLGARLKKAN